MWNMVMICLWFTAQHHHHHQRCCCVLSMAVDIVKHKLRYFIYFFLLKEANWSEKLPFYTINSKDEGFIARGAGKISSIFCGNFCQNIEINWLISISNCNLSTYFFRYDYTGKANTFFGWFFSSSSAFN